jgi:hypothetical protein
MQEDKLHTKVWYRKEELRRRPSTDHIRRLAGRTDVPSGMIPLLHTEELAQLTLTLVDCISDSSDLWHRRNEVSVSVKRTDIERSGAIAQLRIC